ncbi:MATE family efflux transporter [Lachnoclostridium sp. An14]|uniref:MATE family efflux transporter n=1 Tax=Lachnoclostridium sp. An14 TaxID=1965562 RepID=UPI000B398F19|nr:MATE family efflux transporter [Lachnoclostridium sp. An14]OUQ17177.1 MATE family efflux transporter [Lachnoclostridium sp. An14]
MEQQTCARDFARYTVLSVLGTLGVSCYILADTFFVSKGLGTNGLTALNLAIPIYNFIHGSGLMLGMGGATKFSIYKSQGRSRDIDCIYTNTLYLAALLSALFFLTGLLFSGQLSLLLGADGTVFAMTETYLRWLLLFAPAFILNDVFLCYVRNDGSPQLAMVAMLIGSFANIVLDYVFIFPFRMGIFGAIFATGLSPIISIAVMSPHWLRKRHSFHLTKVKPDAAVMGQTVSLGFPSLIAQLSSGIVMITFNALILGITGNTGVAAYGVVANISLVVVAVYTGISQGMQPLVSSAYGRGNRQQMREVFRYALGTTLAVSGLVYLFLFVFASPVAAVFNSERDPILQQIAVSGLKLYFLSVPFAGYNIILATYFTSIERALPAHVLSLLRGLILIIPMAFLMSFLLGMTGIWISYPLTELAVAAAGVAAHRHMKARGRT